MTTPPVDLDDVYKTPIGRLIALSDADLDDLISNAEHALQKAQKIKIWLEGIKRIKAGSLQSFPCDLPATRVSGVVPGTSFPCGD